MQRHIITVSSITYAIKGRDLLRKQGIKAYIEKKTNIKGNIGCGYVIVAEGKKNKIIEGLMHSGVKVLDFSTIA